VRRRYIAVQLETALKVTQREFMESVWSAVTKFFGEYGASQTELALIDYDMEKAFAILRTRHTAVSMVRVALASITKIGDKPAAVHVLVVSGTLKALRKKVAGTLFTG